MHLHFFFTSHYMSTLSLPGESCLWGRKALVGLIGMVLSATNLEPLVISRMYIKRQLMEKMCPMMCRRGTALMNQREQFEVAPACTLQNCLMVPINGKFWSIYSNLFIFSRGKPFLYPLPPTISKLKSSKEELG